MVFVDEPGAQRGAAADAAVAIVPNAPVAVVTADCAPIVLVDGAGGCVAVVHAGWRGLVAGVIDTAVAAMRERGASSISAALGPCIHPECYEFAEADLAPIAEVFGASVRGSTSLGTSALDVPEAVRVALRGAGVTLAYEEASCTACAPGYWSYRARKDVGRQATVAWLT